MAMLNGVLKNLTLGEYGSRCGISTENDELDAVAYSINILAEETEKTATEQKQAVEELETLIRKLEQRIEDRTAALAESEAKLNAISLNSPSTLFLRDSEGRYLLVNPEYERLWGIRQEDILGKTMDGALPAEIIPAQSVEDRQVLETGQAMPIEQEIRLNGETLTYLVTKFPIKDQKGQVMGVGGIGTDITERKRTEEALRGSQNRFRDFAEASADWLWEMDADLRFTYVSPNVERLLGLPPEWHYGKTRAELQGEDLSPESWAAHLRVLEDRQPFRDFVFSRDGRDLRPRWISISGIPVHDADGIFQGYRGVGSDVTERVRMETELRENQNLLQTVFDAVPHWLFAKDADGRMTLVNRSFAGAFGGSPEDFTAKTFRQFPNAEDGQAKIADESDRTVLEKNEPLEFEMTAKDADGISTVRWVIKVPLRNQAGEAVGLVGLSEDITERRRAEDALLKQDSIMRKAQEVAHIGSLEWNLETNTQIWSDEIFRIIGHRPQSFVPNAQRFADALHPDDKKRVLAVLAETVQGGNPFDAECRVVWPDGSLRHVHAQGEVSRDEVGKPLRMIGTVQDITGRKEAEQELRASQEMLVDAVESISEGFVMYDAEDRLLLCNSKYRDFYPQLVDKLEPGTKLEEIARTGFERGVVLQAIGKEEEWLQIRLEQHRTGQGEHEQQLSDGRWVLCTDRKTSAGGTVGIRTDITYLKKAEEALRDNQLLLRTVFDSISHWIFVKDRESRYIMVNQAFAESYGMNPEDFTGKLTEEIPTGTGTEMERFLETDRKVIESGQEWDFGDYPAHLPDGTERVSRMHKSPLRDKEGNVVGLVGVAEDVTEQRKMEEALRESEELFRSTVDNSPSAIFVKDLEGKFLMANKRFEEWYGVSHEKIQGLTSQDIYDSEYADRYVALDHQVQTTGEALEAEMEVPFADGTMRQVIVTKFPVSDSTGKMIGVGTIHNDITEIKKATEALRESEERFRGMVEHLPLAMILKDLEGKYQYVNQRFEEWFGISRESTVGKNSLELFSEEEASLYMALDQDVLQTERSQEKEFAMTFFDGQEHIVRDIKFPMYGANGKVNGVGVILLDLTEQRRTEGQLLQSQKMEAIGQLAGGVAHDFNNMLQVIHGYTRLAMEDANSSSDTQGYLNQVQKASERAASLTRQLLAFSRQQILEKEVFDLNNLIGDQMKMLRRVIGENIELDVHTRSPVLPVLADAGMIEQVLMNLCINARDAMPDGGRLLIETRGALATPDFMAQNPWAREGSYAIIAVNDNGTGMSPDVRAKIFEPFFTTKEQGKGTGLGLSMVYGILQQHEGMITVYSEPGQGTTFTFYLPMVEDLVRDAEEEAPPASAGGSETILIAEDEPEVLNLAVTLLEDKGYTLLTAVDGEEAIEVFNQEGDGIDLIILDVVMPKLGGHQVLEIVRKTKPSLPVLLTTGYSPGKFQMGDYSANRTKMIQKPYGSSQLFQSVRELIDGE